MTSTTYACELAWISTSPGVAPELASEVIIDVDADGMITAVRPAASAPSGATRLPGLVLPGFANAHSHAFHRTLRGRTHTGGGTFWTWREQMYKIAGRLDPDSYLELATAVYAEMALAGVTCVGEFHYVHHAPDGTPYDDPNVMGEALREAARRAGIRLTLLDTCYLAAGIGQVLRPEQRRFGDHDAESWAERAASRRVADAGTRLGIAAHSVRAVPRPALSIIAEAAAALGPSTPVHAHLSEQRAENTACLKAYGLSPAQLLRECGVLGPRTTSVHATHLTAADVSILGSSGGFACFCPTTERDLADGIGPAIALRDAGARLTLGSDQHAMIDLIEEARALEMHERLATEERGRFVPAELLTALTADGHASLGWPEAGRIAAGAPADLVAIRLDTVRTAGVDPAQIVLAATASDVDTVVVGGRLIVNGGQHVLGDVGALLQRAIARLGDGVRRR